MVDLWEMSNEKGSSILLMMAQVVPTQAQAMTAQPNRGLEIMWTLMWALWLLGRGILWGWFLRYFFVPRFVDEVYKVVDIMVVTYTEKGSIRL